MGAFTKPTTILVSFLMLMGMSRDACADRLQIWGSTTCQKRFLEPAAEAVHQATGVKIRVIGVGTGKGLLGLVEGRVPVSAASEDLQAAIHSMSAVAEKTGKSVTVPDNLEYHEITRDTIVPIVHQDNPVSSLTWQQLKEIHTGKIRNWKELGGPDLPIKVVTSHAGSATRAVFQKIVMEGEDYREDVQVVTSTRHEIIEVSKSPNAIGAVSDGFVRINSGQTKKIHTNPITRPLGLITVGPPQPSVQKLIDFLGAQEATVYFQ